MTDAIPRPTPGDIVEIDTEAGPRHVQITHLRAPYPDVVRAILPGPGAADPAAIAKWRTGFIAMVEFGRSFRDDGGSMRVIGHATIPREARRFPTFRLPIRNRDGDIVYWWMWDEEGLTVAPEAGDTDLPIREVLPVETLKKRLVELGRRP